MSNIDDKLNEALNIAAQVADAENDQIISTTQTFQTEENTELVIPQDKDPDADFEKEEKTSINYWIKVMRQ